MTDTSIRVKKKTRQRLASWAELRDLTQGEAIDELLERVDAPKVPEDE
jgi:ribosome assembly protein YihI (activator of Der GTPase)